jgi:outer membrane protein TolC
MKTKITAIVCLAALALSLPVFATEGVTAVTTSIETTSAVAELELTLEEAQNLAIENSYAVKSLLRNIGNTKDLIDDQEELQEDMENLLKLPLAYLPGDITNDFINTLLIKKGYGVKGAETQLAILENTIGQTEEALKIGALTAYYQVILAQKTVELNSSAYENELVHLKTAQIKYDTGVITKLELLQEELAVNTAKTDLDDAMDDLEIRELEFNNTVGLDLGENVKFVSGVENGEMTTLTIEEALALAFENRPESANKWAEYELQEVESSAYKSYYTSSNRQYKYAVEEVEEAMHNYEQSFRDIELDVRTKYLELVKSERALNNMDETISLSREALRVTKLFYQYDLATIQDVSDSEASLKQAEIGKYQLLVGYNIARVMFENSIGVGMPSLSTSSAY